MRQVDQVLSVEHFRDLVIAASASQLALAKSMQMSDREMSVLSMVAYASPLPRLADIRERLGLSAAATTEMIDRLERRGHVHRVREDEDQRVVQVAMTTATRETISSRLAPMLRDVGAILDELDEATALRMAKTLEGVAAAYSAFDPQLDLPSNEEGA